MDLNIFILVICLLGLILISYQIKNKNIIYFLCVMLTFLALKRYFESQEQFQSTQEKEAISSLENAVNKTAETEELQERVGGLETNIEDLKKIMRAQNLSRQMERGEEAKTFSMTESQKRQDSNLESLETEIDILLKMYKEENMNNDKDKYKTLPIYSSCKVRDQGRKNIRTSDNRTTQDLLRDLEKADTLKNLGLNSESAEELNSLLQAEDSQNIDVNFNLL
jgi:hypothetical protein|tara:strand:+ start:406 stop:1074 length:669 start_codon:yes stop_codon:yes gene_type:complete